MLRNFFILISALLIGTTVSAQFYTPARNRIITTDYNQCLVGVKDTLGNWIIQPVYEHIVKLSKPDYLVMVGGKYGVVDTNGTVLVPAIYDKINSTYQNYAVGKYYHAELNEKFGVVGAGNKIIVPIKYDKISFTSDTTILAREGKRTWYIYQLDGSYSQLKWKSKVTPYHMGDGLYRVSRRRWPLQNRVGIVDDSGKVLLKRKFAAVSYNDDYRLITVNKRKRKGYITTDGKEIWPSIFDARSSRTWHNSRYPALAYGNFRLAPDHRYYGIESINGKYGVISSTGDTILPFVYDNIAYFTSSSSKRPHILQVDLQNKSGIYQIGAGWILPVEYEEMESISSFYTAVDSSFVGYFSARRNGRYGMQTTTGKTIIPFDFYGYQVTEGKHIFYGADSILQFTFSSATARLSLVSVLDTIPRDNNAEWMNKNYTSRRLIPNSGDFSVYQAAENVKVYYNPLHINDTVYGPDTFYVPFENRHMDEGFPDSVLNGAVYYVRSFKPEAHLPNGDKFYEFPNNIWGGSKAWKIRFVVYGDRENTNLDPIYSIHDDSTFVYYITHSDMVFRNDGKILCDRWKYIRVGRVSATVYDGTFFHCEYSDDREEIIDGNGNIIVPTSPGPIYQFNRNYALLDEDKRQMKTTWVIRDNHTGKVHYRCRKGRYYSGRMFGNVIIDYSADKGNFAYNFIDKKMLVSGLNDVVPLDDSATIFRVRTCAGHLGIMNDKGQWLVDSVYDYYTPLMKTGEVYRVEDWMESDVIQTFFAYVILYNDSGSVVFDVEKKSSVADKSTLVSKIINVCDTITADTIVQANYFSNYLPGKIALYTTPERNAAMRAWHTSVLFDSIFCRQRSQEGLYYHYIPLDYSCQYCIKKHFARSFELTNTENASNAYFVHFVSDSLISFSGSTSKTLRWFSNATLHPDGPHILTLDSLFRPDADWRNFIINTVLNYVNTHIRVNGDCHNPAAFPMLLNDRFIISPQGIHLYPLDFTEKEKQLMILVPWSDADYYLRQDIKPKLPIPTGK